MKRVIINEDVLKKDSFYDAVLMDEMEEGLRKDLSTKNTSLGDNPAIPDENDKNFLEKLAVKRFKETKRKLEDIGTIDTKADELSGALGEVTKKCQEIEEPIRRNLEKIVYNKVIDLFCPPEGALNFEVNLVDEISDTSTDIRVQSEDDDYEYDDMAQKDSLMKEVYKRRCIDAFIMGASLRYSMDLDNYIKEIHKLNRNLPNLYEQAMSINDYNLFSEGEVKITDEHKHLAGTSKVVIGNEDTKTEINAKGMIFPILLSETIKSFMELFASHGLPKKKEDALYVMNKADFLQAEQWDMRLGPAMWDCFTDCLGEYETQMIPYIFMRFCSLPVDRFNELTREILIRSKKAKGILNRFKELAKEDKDYMDFSDRMKKGNENISVINDSYIHPDEL